MYQERTLKCKDCDEEFIFTVGEQEFYAEKGFQNDPQRCKNCRTARKNSDRPRQYYDATCDECNGPAKIPFEPRDDRPVYCSECYAKKRA